LGHTANPPTACAVGCILAPLRGFEDSLRYSYSEAINKKAPLAKAGLLDLTDS
jgi:hypothetical protein